MENHPNLNFARLFDGILRAKNITHEDLEARTGYSRKTFSNIINKEHIPKKKTVITIGIALGLNIEQMHVFLYYAGYVLSVAIRVDNYYIEVIKEIKEDTIARVVQCNDKLKLKKLNKRYLLGMHR